ncbi:MbcA/ParS/Xre antitoxin family protein [Thiohalorhabdus methylotrophus]|uniref:MbcA/ParS/Xre antitoxin family protein n=1 Tax=Thiohalorhabdus methylotrophus TaxID=3242694 RepID=A0ABV4U282_9GAMM
MEEGANRLSPVITEAVLKSAEYFGIDDAALGGFLGTGPEVIEDYRTGATEIDPESPLGGRARHFVRAFLFLDIIAAGDAVVRNQWLRNYNHALYGVPLELMRDPAGLARVADYLDGHRRR